MRCLVASLFLLCAVVPAGTAQALCEVSETGAISLLGRVRDVEVVGSLAYVANGSAGLSIIDVSDPGAPALVGALDSPGYSQDVEVSGDFAYLAGSDFAVAGGLRIVDVSDPSAPAETATFGSSIARIAVSGGLAYVTEPSSGLRIIDVSNPANPLELGAIDVPGFVVDVDVAGNLAYLAIDDSTGTSGVSIIDVSNPALPVPIGSTDTADRLPFDVAVSDDLAYVPAIGGSLRGLIITDVSDPFAPAELAFLVQPNARDVRIVGNRAYYVFGNDISFGSGQGGLRIIDTTDPTTPINIGRADTMVDEFAGVDVEVTANEDWVYVAVTGQGAGLRIFRVSDCPTATPIEVDPGGAPKVIPMSGDLLIPVAIFGSETLDVTNFDQASLKFGPAGAEFVSTSFEDVDDDGFQDLYVTFRAGDAGLSAADDQLCFEGENAGEPFAGCDWVTVNEPPYAIAEAIPGTEWVPIEMRFDGTQSFDPEGGSLFFDWSFENGAASGPIVTWVFETRQPHEVTLSVEDDLGQVDDVTIIVNVGVPVPALSPWALAGLVGLLCSVGFGMVRSQAPNHENKKQAIRQMTT